MSTAQTSQVKNEEKPQSGVVNGCTESGIQVQFLQDLCDEFHGEFGYQMIFCAERGEIVAAVVRERVGTIHGGGAKIMAGELDEIAVTAREARRSKFMKEGVSVAIDIENNRVATCGVTGPVKEVRPLAKLARLYVVAMIRAERARCEQDDMAEEMREKERDVAGRHAAELEQGVAALVEDLQVAGSQLSAVVEQVEEAGKFTFERVGIAARSTQQAESGVETIASGSEELSASIEHIRKQMRDAAGTSENAVESARAASDKMAELGQASREISSIAELITEIAEQTNLLALNAAIEAAHAGEAGQGFAVVANEVKSLARQTGEATDRISAQIKALQHQSSGAVEAINRILSTIEHLNVINSEVAGAVEQQASASQDITSNCQTTAEAAREANEAVGDVRQAAEQSSEAVRRIDGVADGLSEKVKRLQEGIQQVVQRIRGS
ncbi:MAG: hypothetical protein EA428_05245 [Spirochaetaceae bacterium]|nr:MAG: hypothetical protein EA428_05245 [Spirochaetaceae bacterium]